MNAARSDMLSPWWRRIWTTPIGPTLIVGRFQPRPRALEIIAASGLPAELQDLVRSVVSRTHLWNSEQSDVAAELVSHLAEALEAGQRAPETIRSFGDPAAVAQLIRRSKQRNRPLLWQAWRRLWQAFFAALALLLVIYALLTIRFHSASPSIRRDYWSVLNSEVKDLRQEDRAWPIYRQAVLAASVSPPDWGAGERLWTQVRPGDERWPEVEAFLTQSEAVMDLTRAAAALPRLGIAISAEEDHELTAHWLSLHGIEYRPPPREKMSENPPVIGARLPHLGEMRKLSRYLVMDTHRAAGARDAKRIMENLEALLSIAAHLDQSPFAISEQVSAAVFISTVQAAGEVLANDPDVLSREHLVRLAHRIASHTRQDLQVNLEEDRLFVLDTVQRMYTDDGSGSGRLTRAGVQQMLKFDSSVFDEYTLQSSDMDPESALLQLTAPLATATLASRREVIEEYDRLAALYQQHLEKPMWDWESRIPGGMQSYFASEIWQKRLLPLSLFLPGFSALAEHGEKAAQYRDATLTAIALELWHREHGAYPDTLELLSGLYLPEVPRDRFDGQPLKYALIGGRPRLYSVGWDRADNGGIPLPEDFSGPRMSEFRPPTAGGADPQADWVLWPPQK